MNIKRSEQGVLYSLVLLGFIGGFNNIIHIMCYGLSVSNSILLE